MMAKAKLNKKNSLLLFVAAVFLVASAALNKSFTRPLLNISKQQSAINLDKQFLTFLSASHKMMIADLFWITTLIESDLEHYKKRDLNSWIYLRFDTLLELDPKNLRAYRFGGKYLSIVKDDLEGAKDIFERGLAKYPEDYQLNYDAAFLYTFELGEYKRGYQLYDKIKDHPQAPKFIPSLLNRIKYQATGDLELAFQALWDNYQNSPDGFIKNKMHSDLYAIKAELDLKCLNSKDDSTCDRVDLEGNRYLFQSGSFIAPKDFTPYQLFKK